MSKTVGWEWVCPACDIGNPSEIKKPTAITPTSASRTCKGCDSRFIFSVKKVAGKHEVNYTVVHDELSKLGLIALEKKREKQKPPVTAPTKEKENARI